MTSIRGENEEPGVRPNERFLRSQPVSNGRGATIIPFSQVGYPNYNPCDEGQTVKYDFVVSNLQVGVIRYRCDTEVAQSLRSEVVPCGIIERKCIQGVG